MNTASQKETSREKTWGECPNEEIKKKVCKKKKKMRERAVVYEEQSKYSRK